MHANIYAVRDTVADAIVGGLQLHRADAAAIRTFGDIASQRDSIVAMHPGDFELVCLGSIDGLSITPDARVVITGAQWLAAQQPATDSTANG